jgi:Na+/proline symporter
MFLALHPVDFSLVALLFVVLLAIGVVGRRPRCTSSEFLLANKDLSAMPVGLSLAATLVPGFGAVGSMLLGLGLIGMPGQAYGVGFRLLLILLGMWLAVPLVWRYVLPIYQGLGLTSIYEYLELRFDRRTRTLASIVFLMWRMFWVAGALALGCHMLVMATGWPIPTWSLVCLLGAVATTYTFLGGVRAVVWTDAVQLGVMGSAVLVLVLSVWMALDGGAERVWHVAESLERSRILPPTGDGHATWLQWDMVPHAMLAMLAFFVADQVTLHRLLAVRDVKVARRALVVGCTSLTIVFVLLTYLGLGLLAFYHDHADQVRAKWITNVDPATRHSLASLGNGGLALNWDDRFARVDAQNIEALVEQRKIVRPNSRDPIDDADDLMDQNGIEGLNVLKLLTRYPPKADMRRGEVVLHTRANDELLPWYIATQLPWGLVGLGIAAILAAIMSSVDSGLLALSGMVSSHARDSNGEDAIRDLPDRITPLAITAFGIIVTLGANWIVLALDLFRAVIMVTGTLGGPLLAVFLLGIFTRRTNPVGVRIGLVFGSVLTAWLTCSNMIASFAWAWPFTQPIQAGWVLSLGVVLTLISGYVASFLVGTRSADEDLRGLVRGLGKLGELDEEVVMKIRLPRVKRWR